MIVWKILLRKGLVFVKSLKINNLNIHPNLKKKKRKNHLWFHTMGCQANYNFLFSHSRIHPIKCCNIKAIIGYQCTRDPLLHNHEFTRSSPHFREFDCSSRPITAISASRVLHLPRRGAQAEPLADSGSCIWQTRRLDDSLMKLVHRVLRHAPLARLYTRCTPPQTPTRVIERAHGRVRKTDTFAGRLCTFCTWRRWLDSGYTRRSWVDRCILPLIAFRSSGYRGK